ncbi:hypothetical protein P7C73_g5479, partial [Tremellales sp. Uapishka_1]
MLSVAELPWTVPYFSKGCIYAATAIAAFFVGIVVTDLAIWAIFQAVLYVTLRLPSERLAPTFSVVSLASIVSYPSTILQTPTQEWRNVLSTPLPIQRLASNLSLESLTSLDSSTSTIVNPPGSTWNGAHSVPLRLAKDSGSRLALFGLGLLFDPAAPKGGAMSVRQLIESLTPDTAINTLRPEPGSQIFKLPLSPGKKAKRKWSIVELAHVFEVAIHGIKLRHQYLAVRYIAFLARKPCGTDCPPLAPSLPDQASVPIELECPAYSTIGRVTVVVHGTCSVLMDDFAAPATAIPISVLAGAKRWATPDPSYSDVKVSPSGAENQEELLSTGAAKEMPARVNHILTPASFVTVTVV